MSTLEDLDDLERDNKERKDDGDGKKPDDNKDTDMEDADGEKKDEEDDLIDEEILRSSTRDITNRRKLLENDMRIMKSEFQRLTHEQNTMKEKIKDNLDKIENNRYGFPRFCFLYWRSLRFHATVEI
jgi:26S proteasome regulatory subunit T5